MSITQLLKAIIKMPKTSKTLTYGDLVSQFGDQGLGIVTILFALPSALPISAIPGFSFLFGLPIVFVALHLIAGKHILWLPKKLSENTLDRTKLVKIVKKCLPYLLYVERFLKPRLPFFSTPVMERVHGVVLLVLSLLLLLPIPLSNFIFASIIICFGFGIAEKDGFILAIGYLASIIYLVFLGVVSHEIFKAFFT
jgi:hypothetical protein